MTVLRIQLRVHQDSIPSIMTFLILFTYSFQSIETVKRNSVLITVVIRQLLRLFQTDMVKAMATGCGNTYQNSLKIFH